MRIAITGASGLIGAALTRVLKQRGDHVVRLVRRPTYGPDESRWDPEKGLLERELFENVDAVVNLSGASIGDRRWSASRKRELRDSRVGATALLATALAESSRRPDLLCASAIGYYGDGGDRWLDETSPRGEGFLAQLCQQWEAAAQPARDAGIRVAHLRTSVVMTAQGGALPKMLPPFRMGLGGVMGSGKQYWSWISLDDLLRTYLRVLDDSSFEGPVVASAPNPVTNAEFTRTLGRVLGRPTIFPLPAFAAKLVIGEMAEEALLVGQRVRPAKLLEQGFGFEHPELESALRAALH